MRTDKLFSQINCKTFKLISILIFFIGDLAIARTIYLKFADFDYYKSLFSIALQRAGSAIDQVPPIFLKEQYQLFLQALVLILVLYLLLHYIVSIFYYFEKKTTIAYYRFWAITAAFLSLYFFVRALANPHQFTLLQVWFLPQTFLYIFNFQGIKRFLLTPPVKSEAEQS